MSWYIAFAINFISLSVLSSNGKGTFLLTNLKNPAGYLTNSMYTGASQSPGWHLVAHYPLWIPLSMFESWRSESL